MNLAKILAFALSLTFSTTPALAHLDFKLDEPVSQAKKEPKPSRYARDRKVDIQKLSLDVTPNFGNKSIAGSVILQFTPIAKPLEELTLDAVRMTVKRLICSDPVADYQVTDSEIAITFAKPIPVGQEVTLTIDYSAYPQKGLYFRSPATGYPQAEEQIFSQGEMIESRHWFPCYDYPNMKFKSEITCHVPEGMTVLSNGKVVSSEKDSNTGLCAVHWYQDKPHVSYLVTLVAGYFAKLDDKYHDIDLTFYFPPSEMEGAKIVFPTTKPALAFFEEEIGVPFPWAQYGQVVVRDHPTGGMENTTITTLNDMFMPAKELENIGTDGIHTPDTGYYTSENAMAHELAHQWFGDYVTCKDWSHSWLNEGFATYYAFLFLKKRRGIETFRYGQYEDLKNIAERPSDDKPIVNRKYESEWEQFDQTTYEKGAWVLHMLRSQLGEELYRKCIKTYLERHKFGTVSTEDLNSVIEELSGRSFDAFFDQWLYHAGIPSLNVTYSWNQKSKLAKVSIYQTQKVDDKALLFDLPVPLQFKTKRETINKTVDLKSAHEDFYIPLSEPPDLVRIDPELTLLADIHFDAPQAMLNQQLADPDDMVGRLIALEHLEKNSDPETIKKVKDILNNDSFYGVRIKASNCLKKMHTDEALNALISSVEQPDARVRFAVIRDIGNYFNASARKALVKQLQIEHNPMIVACALKGLSMYRDPDVHQELIKHLHNHTYKNIVEIAAMETMKAQEDPTYLADIKEFISSSKNDASTNAVQTGLDAIAFSSRNENDRSAARDTISEFLNSKRANIRLSAIKALGTLRDPKAKPVLNSLTLMHDSEEKWSAWESIAQIESAAKPNAGMTVLQENVRELKKANQDLKSELEDLKKWVKANGEAARLHSKPVLSPASAGNAHKGADAMKKAMHKKAAVVDSAKSRGAVLKEKNSN